MRYNGQNSVEFILLLSFVFVAVLIIAIRYAVSYMFIGALSSPTVGPYGNKELYKRTENLYYLEYANLYVEEYVIDGFAPMILQVSQEKPLSSSIEKPSGSLLVDLPSKGGYAYLRYQGEQQESIDSFFNNKGKGPYRSAIVFVQTSDTLYTTSWFSSSDYPVRNLPVKPRQIHTLEDLYSLQGRYPNADIIVYPETYGGLYTLSRDGEWSLCKPLSSISDSVEGTYLNKLKKKYLPELLRKDPPIITTDGEEERFGYTTN